MNRPSIATWVLLGALLASISIHAGVIPRPCAPVPSAQTARPAETAATEGGSSCCEGIVELSPEVADRVLEYCRGCCPRRDEFGAREERAIASLELELRRDVVDVEAVERLADQLGELRRDSTVTSVKSLIELRRLLTADEMSALLRCATSAEECASKTGE